MANTDETRTVPNQSPRRAAVRQRSHILLEGKGPGDGHHVLDRPPDDHNLNGHDASQVRRSNGLATNGHSPDDTLKRLSDDDGKFSISLPAGMEAEMSAISICGALVIVLASHTGSTDFLFTLVPDGNHRPQQGVENMSSPGRPAIQFVPFHIAVDWSSDVQDFLHSVQAGLPASKLHRIQHIGHLDPRFGQQSRKFGPTGPDRSVLLVDCSLQRTEIHLTFASYPTAVDQRMIRHLCQQYEFVLREICSVGQDRGKLTSDLQVVDLQDLRDIWTWNATVPERADSCIHDHFARTVRKKSNEPAISAHDGELTYHELDQLSTILAHRLLEFGVQETIVPIHIEKSMWTPVAQLGVMKAGAASVVLDASQPEERLRTIIHEVHPRVVLTSVANEHVAYGLSSRPVLVVGKALLSHSLQPKIMESDLPLVSPASRLYVVFTSGSTGLPKGATITHSNFASAIRHQQKKMKIQAGQRVFDFASYAFDVAWSNFLHTITAGGCLCIPSDEERKQDIPAALRKYRADYAHLTPSVAWFAPEELPETVKFLQFSGEELKASLVQAFGDRATIINTYGPAECSVTSTLQLVDASIANQAPPIGHGVGSCTWVVSLDGTQLVPIGAVGELWIEGPIVGSGYLNDPKKTAAAFVEDPPWLLHSGFATENSGRKGRLYRTGDLVRYNRHDGSLFFVGRKDSQVKIRGQRVELGEVEHHLRHSLPDDLHRRLHILAEVIQPTGNLQPTLVALVSPRDESFHSKVSSLVSEAAAVWDTQLQDKVPGYMIPAAYIPFESFPMTATGKTDRRSLRAAAAGKFWDHVAAGSEQQSLPTSDEETEIRRVWSMVLNLPEQRIPTDAAFTRLGGDSITAMQVVSRCRARNIFLTVGDVLRLRTIKALAVRSRTAGVSSKPRNGIAAQYEAATEGQPWPLSPMQQLFFDAHPQGLNYYTQSFLLRVTRRITLEQLRDALTAVVKRHSMLRARFQQLRDAEGGWEQIVVPAGPGSFAVSEHQANARLQQIVQTRQAGLDIRHGPVFAADLFSGGELADEDQSLLLSAHHIIIDLVSWRVIWHDLAQWLATPKSPLLVTAQPPPSFQEWCRLQREEAQTLDPSQVLPYSVEPGQWDYWGIELGDNYFRDSDTFEHVLDVDSTALLLGSSNDALRTETLDILVGSLVHSFRAAFPERSAPPIFLEGHGREPIAGVDIDVAETVGWFTTLHPVSVPGASTDSILDSIRHAKDTRARVPGKGRPYIASRYHTTAGREAFAGHQRVEILLNYRGVFQQLESSDALLQREKRPERAMAIAEFGDDYQRMALVEINMVVEGGRARISTTTHTRMKHRDRLEHWVQRGFPGTLRAAARDLLGASPRPTLADFPLLSISYAGLDALLADAKLAAARVRDIYPCTPVQEGILLSEKKGTASYRNSWVWRCFSSTNALISPERLAAAWEIVARQHTVFATIFAPHPETGRYLQVVLQDPKLRCVSMSTAPPVSPTRFLLEMNAPTPADNGHPEYTITVCHSSDGEVACRLDMTHALIDASSIPVLLGHLAHAYNQPPSLTDPPEHPPFSDVVAHILHNMPASENLAYWRTYLSGTQRCHLPGDLPTIQGRRIGGQERYGLISLPAATTHGIAAYCRQHNATRAVFLQVAWALVLTQFTGLREVCFGYVCSGRDTPVDGIEAIVGPLISMLVARVDLSETRLQRLLLAVGEQSIEHLAHQHTSLGEIQHGMEGTGPLFNTAITVREQHRYGSENGLRLDEIREEDPHEYDVLLSAVLGANTTAISIQYRGDYMSRGMATGIASGLQAAIGYIIGLSKTIEHPARSIDTSDTLPIYQAYFEHLTGIDESSAISYWRSRFENLEASDFPPLPSSAYQPQTDSEVTHALTSVHWPGSYTATAAVQASWAAVQAAHTNSDDVIFGTVSSETPPECLQLASALPTRITLRGDVKITELLDRLHTESTSRPELNTLRIREISEEASRASQFQTLLAIVTSVTETSNEEIEKPDQSNLRSVGGETVLDMRPVALMLQCYVRGADIRLCASFDSEVIGRDRVTRMLWQFERAMRWLSNPNHLQNMVVDIETVSEQDLVDIWRWNSAVPEPNDLLVHDLFGQVAQRQPDAPAISAWDGELTYRELDDLSTRLALYLVHRLAIGSGAIIPIYIEKSQWTPVAQLAVMKAGAASVLLDSTQPVDRARTIASQVKPDIILTSVTNQASASLLGASELVVLDKDFVAKVEHGVRGRTLPRKSVPSDLLYVVFTSGSTGLPKGALITHGNFASAIQHQQRALGYKAGLRVYDFVSYAFDVTWSNMLHSLTSGSCLCIPSEDQRKNDIVGSLQASKATLVDLTPSMLRLLNPQDLPQLRQVLLSGESFTKATLGDWARHPGLLNTYGPAECSVKATMAPVEWSSCENDIGCGEGLLTWVVSVQNPDKLAPLGAIGELWLEGPLVGQGYLGDQQKTAAAFIIDPPWLLRGGAGRPGRRGRLYRTGDLVRYDTHGHSGRLLFIGRKDSQIKIRGQRVELGEIETHVRNGLAKEGAEEVHVVVDIIQPSDSTNPMLVAFVDTSSREKAIIQNCTVGLVNQLNHKLPAYMIPTAYIPVECIPVGPTGKTNRRLLKELGASLTLEQLAELSPGSSSRSKAISGDRRSPSTTTEEVLLQTCATLLNMNVARLSLDDNFFRLGGDSIDAMRLVGAAGERGVALSVADIFNQPTLADLAHIVDSRSSALQAGPPQHDDVEPFSLMSLDLPPDGIRAQAAKLCGVRADQVADVFPTTALQEGLLAMTMRRPGDYILREARPLADHIDRSRFRAAWEQVVRATPILRTRIVNLPSCGLAQVVVAEDSIVWHASNNVNDALRHLEQTSVEFGKPLAQFALVQDDDASNRRCYFVWSMHHSLFDGWSLEIIEKLLTGYYYGQSMPKAVPMQKFLQYLQRQSALELEAFWRGQFDGVEAQPFFHLPSPSYQPHSDQILQLDIDGIDWTGEYTASTAIRAAWAILLSSYSGSTDAVFGVTVSGRQALVSGIEKIIAPLIATVPLRVAVNRRSSLEALLQQVQVQAVNMIPFEQAGLQRIRQIDADCEQACKFQTLLLVQPEARNEEPTHLGLFQETEEKGAYDDFAAFNTYPLMLECQPQRQAMRLRISIDSRVVSPACADRMGQQFVTILRQVLATSARAKPVSQVRAISGQDLHDIWAWNSAVEGINICVHDLFAQVAQRQPETAAICAWDGEFSYRELDDLSTKLAESLLGDSPGRPLTGTIVPLYFEKSKWMPVAQLGVMKAGGASVALDANLPAERLRSIIQQVEPRFILSSTANMKLAGQLFQPVRVVGEQLQHLPRTSGVVLPSVDPSSTVYVVFTSGSTGIPKGAMVSHSNFATAVHYQQSALELSRQSRVWDFVSYAFDVSWSNVLQTLCAGGCLCIPSEFERRHNPGASMVRLRVNYAHLTPTVARLLVGVDLPDLRIVSFIGEPLRAADVAYWQHRARVINTYGPAECTPVATVQVVEPDGADELCMDPSVGRGVGVATWVVDITADEDELAAVGAVGELWLEGPLVGQGYLKNPEKTAHAFVETPAWLLRGNEPAGFHGRRGRLYRTGDMVRYNCDGTLTFVGRKDAQVKIRGQRVELGEVEHHVRRAFSPLRLSQVVAELITPAESNEPLLVAFLQAATGDGSRITDAVSTAYSRLVQSVPSYMIPAAYVPLDHLPMTASGKTDRITLRKNGARMKRHELGFRGEKVRRRAPENPTEIQVLDLVARQLRMPPETLSMDDSFIRVGGDSIAAMQFASLALEEGLAVTVGDVLTARSLVEIAAKTRTSPRASARSATVVPFAALNLRDKTASFIDNDILPRVQIPASRLSNIWPVSTTQKVYIDDALRTPRRSYYQFYVDFLPSVDRERLAQSCRSLLNRHDIFRSVFVSVHDRFYQVVFEDIPFSVDHQVSSEDLEAAFERDRALELGTPAVLGTPFVRVKILSQPNVGVRLVLSLSHALYDGITLGILAQDLSSLYQGMLLPEAPSFAGYLDHRISRAARAHDYWRKLLHGASVTTGAPDLSPGTITDGPPTVLDRTVTIPNPPPGVTTATLFTAACAIALARVTGCTADDRDLVFGRVVSTRATLPVEFRDLVGPCINTVPVRVNAAAAAAAAASKHDRESVLTAVQLQYINGIPHETASPDGPDTDYGGFNFTFSSTSTCCTTQFQNIADRPAISGMPVAPGSVLDARIDVDLPVAPAFLQLYGTPQLTVGQEGQIVNLKVTAGPAFSDRRVRQILDELCSAFVGSD